MNCKAGIWIEDQNQSVPCGQCMACRINKGRLWSARIIMEWLQHPNYAFFITLTYDDAHVPYCCDESGTPIANLNKKSFLKWLDNAQTAVGPFRYYAIGEYGSYTFRPHYHLAVFPSQYCKVSELLAYWTKGFTSCTELNHARARYLANYTTKALTKATDERLQSHQEPEFRTSSRNPPLGATFVDLLAHHYTQGAAKRLLDSRGDVERNFRCDGKIYPLGNWALAKLRRLLSIPALHRDRIKANPNYLDFHECQEAECEFDDHHQQEHQLNATKEQGFHRGAGQKV